MGKAIKITTDAKRRYVAKQIAKSLNRSDDGGVGDKFETVLKQLNEELGIRYLPELNQVHRQEFIEELRERVEEEDISRGTAANYISAWNRIVEYAEKPELRISAAEEDLSRGSFEYKGHPEQEETMEEFRGWCLKKYEETEDRRYLTLYYAVPLQRHCGLRNSESLFTKITEKDWSNGYLHLGREDQTKNGRERDIPIFKQEQEEALSEAKAFALSKGYKSLTPPEVSKKEMINFAQRARQEFKKETGISFRYHGFRHAFAQEMYERYKEEKIEEKIRNGEEPVLTKEEEKEIKQQVSEALGHSRLDITKAYGI